MIVHRCFTCIILLLTVFTMAIGDLKKLSCSLKRNEKEQLLEKFLMNAETHLMQNCPSRHLTIIAPKNQILRDATPIFKGRPYFVGNHSKVLVQAREYGNKNCVFIFVDTVDYDYLSSVISHLPTAYGTKVQIVFTTNILRGEVNNIINMMYEKLIENVTISFMENNEFKTFQVLRVPIET